MTKTGRGTVEVPEMLVKKRANENRALLEVSPRTIRTMPEYKCQWYDSKLVVIDAARTSQTCSACRVVDAASRISRLCFVCTNCGTMFNTDVNSAKNIFVTGISRTGGLPGTACEPSRTIGRKQEEEVREGESSAFQG